MQQVQQFFGYICHACRFPLQYYRGPVLTGSPFRPTVSR
ncbi:MAG: hypothetical protein KUG70_10215 [Rhodobacteraceae bacterium]|nr:hypothetical protein [Paracoccaceae bacterium]